MLTHRYVHSHKEADHLELELGCVRTGGDGCLVPRGGFVEVDDVPDSSEVLFEDRTLVKFFREQNTGTHVSLDVLVLEVERVLPDVDTDDRQRIEERVLVRGC